MAAPTGINTSWPYELISGLITVAEIIYSTHGNMFISMDLT